MSAFVDFFQHLAGPSHNIYVPSLGHLELHVTSAKTIPTVYINSFLLVLVFLLPLWKASENRVAVEIYFH